MQSINSTATVQWNRPPSASQGHMVEICCSTAKAVAIVTVHGYSTTPWVKHVHHQALPLEVHIVAVLQLIRVCLHAVGLWPIKFMKSNSTIHVHMYVCNSDNHRLVETIQIVLQCMPCPSLHAKYGGLFMNLAAIFICYYISCRSAFICYWLLDYQTWGGT